MTSCVAMASRDVCNVEGVLITNLCFSGMAWQRARLSRLAAWGATTRMELLQRQLLRTKLRARRERSRLRSRPALTWLLWLPLRR